MWKLLVKVVGRHDLSAKDTGKGKKVDDQAEIWITILLNVVKKRRITEYSSHTSILKVFISRGYEGTKGLTVAGCIR